MRKNGPLSSYLVRAAKIIPGQHCGESAKSRHGGTIGSSRCRCGNALGAAVRDTQQATSKSLSPQTHRLRRRIGSSLGCRLFIAIISGKKPGFANSISYRRMTLASATVCSKDEIFRPMQPLAWAESFARPDTAVASIEEYCPDPIVYTSLTTSVRAALINLIGHTLGFVGDLELPSFEILERIGGSADARACW